VNRTRCERVGHPPDFLPYGLENTPSGFTNSCSTNYKFTGYERDTETGNDYAFARYYSQREERFISPDPLDGEVADPQTLNKYTYARNNPMNFTDPSGLIACGDPYCGEPGLCPLDCGGAVGSGGTGCLVLCVGGTGGYSDGGAGVGPPSYSPPAPGSDPNSPDGESSGDPWALGCESLGIPCGMNFPGGSGGLDPSGCTYGGGNCGGMIYGWTKDANGNIIGDFPGEELCTLGPLGSCLSWNLSLGKWKPEDNASRLAREVNQRPIGKFVAATYGGSLAAGALVPVLEACAANWRACTAAALIATELAHYLASPFEEDQVVPTQHIPNNEPGVGYEGPETAPISGPPGPL
jgi:RHS repeat-associated protein